MRHLLALLFVSACAMPSASPPPPVGDDVIPGQGFGPISLGMTREQVATLGLPDQPGFTERVRKVGPYEVAYDEHDTVTSITMALADSKDGLTVRQRHLPRTASLDEAARILGCGAMIPATGGNVYHCPNDTLILKQGGDGLGPVELQIIRK